MVSVSRFPVNLRLEKATGPWLGSDSCSELEQPWKIHKIDSNGEELSESTTLNASMVHEALI